MSADIEIIGSEEHPPDTSVKLHGPPGTGKTTQTMERLQALLEADHTVSDICFVTYRREMAERFLERLYEAGIISFGAKEEPWNHATRYIGTLHAVCNRLSDVETPRDRRLETIMHEFCMEEFGVPYFRKSGDVSETPGELMFSARSHCIENEIPLSKWHRTPQHSAIAENWRHYPELTEFNEGWEARKADEGFGDFEDMLIEVRENDLRPPRRILAIDEYHDFTPIQDGICRTWMDSASVVIVNGDPLQVVYSYKGASPEFYTSLELPEVLLPESYRVPRRIWGFACEALKPEHEPPRIEPREAAGEVSEYLSVPLDENDSRTDGKSPEWFLDAYGEDTLLLARTRKQTRDIGSALKAAGVIFASQQGAGGWNGASKRRAIYNVLAGLEGVSPPKDTLAQQTLTSREWDRGQPADNIWFYGNEIADFIDRVPAEYIAGKSKSKLDTLLRGQSRVTGEEFGEWLTPEFWQVFTNGADAVEELLSYDDKPVIARALRRYDGDLIRGRYDTRVLTIHASKGGEAENVILYDGIPNRVSAEIRRDASEARNEARLWYVGSTRASERLVVARSGWEWVHSYLPDVDAERPGLEA